MIKFSIITVCYNAASNIENTIKSVLAQNYSEYEYIIIDGGSKDGTLDIIKSYSELCPQIKYISEADEGLYHAMNKGIRMASGDYIEFLNSGDLLANENVLSLVAVRIEKEQENEVTAGSNHNKMIVYGDIIYINSDGSESVRKYGSSCGKAIYYGTGDCVNHQACFAAAACFDKYDFDYKKYRICADRDWMMKQTRSGCKWIATNEILVKYDLSDESISVRDKGALKREERLSLKDNYPGLLPIYMIFDFCRNNKLLAGILHKVYEVLYIK